MQKQTNVNQHLEINAINIREKIKQELGYDSDLVKNSDDERELTKMTDLNREKEIFERK